MISVILSGGAGSRLWPVSRQSHPKPFLNLPDGRSLLENNLLRASAFPDICEVLIVTNKSLLFKTIGAVARVQCPPVSLILEPFGRNTAPAIAVAALEIENRHGGQSTMLIMPADHLIVDQPAFVQAVDKAKELAATGMLVTFGIYPDKPETGYGYIEADGNRVLRFVEKPDVDTAIQYCSSCRFLWNSGIFCFTAETVLQEMRLHAPDLMAAVEKTFETSKDYGYGKDALELVADIFATVPDISIDYALMEKSDRVAVVPCDIGWSDIGSWTALSSINPSDENNNHLNSSENIMVEGCTDCDIHSEKRLVAALGLKDILIVDTPDALLVANKSRAQDVKYIYDRLKKENHESYKAHTTDYRPWGWYTVLESGPWFKVKRLNITPGASISLQRHHHRNEHWVVVSGMAEVTCEGKNFFLNTNESTYIKAGHQHRITNPGLLDLIMIEVQSGEYLGEDDIVRLDDEYGRKFKKPTKSA